MSTIEQGSLVSGVKLLGAVTVALAAEVRACGLPQLGQTAQKMLVKLNRSAAAAQIGSDATILADGADITLLVSQSVQDFRAQNYEKFGTDLGNLAARLSSSSVCQSIACEVVEGILSGVGTGYKSLKACEADVRKAERFFLSAAQAFERRQFDSAVENFAKALNIVSLAVSACGLQKEMGYIAQEANVFGLANATTALGNGVALLVHGADFYHEVHACVLVGVDAHHCFSGQGKISKPHFLYLTFFFLLPLPPIFFFRPPSAFPPKRYFRQCRT